MNTQPRALLPYAATALFSAAACAFADGVYALGVWLALGCVACGALCVFQQWAGDRPETLHALAVLDASIGRIDNRLKAIDDKAAFIATNLSAFSQSRTAVPGARLSSPVRPPINRG